MILPQAEAEEIIGRAKRLLAALNLDECVESEDSTVDRFCSLEGDIVLVGFKDGGVNVGIGSHSVVWCKGSEVNFTRACPELMSKVLKRLTEVMVLDDLAGA